MPRSPLSIGVLTVRELKQSEGVDIESGRGELRFELFKEDGASRWPAAAVSSNSL